MPAGGARENQSMIHVLYDHGDERPASGLTTAQIQAARLDAAGVLWADLEAPDAAELARILGEAFRLDVATGRLFLEYGGAAEPVGLAGCALVPLRSSAAHTPALDQVSRPNAGTLGLYLGSNFVISLHAEPWPLVAALRQAVAAGETSMAQGTAVLAAEIMWRIVRHDREVADAAAAALSRLGRQSGGETAARLTRVRGDLVALGREVRQQRKAALWLARDPASPIGASDRGTFALIEQALSSQLERTEALLAEAARLAELQRLAIQRHSTRSLQVIAALLLALWLTVGAIAVVALMLALRR